MSDTFELWRFEKLREAATRALCEMAQLLMHHETKNYLEKEDVYHKLVEANKLLAEGIYEATQP